MYTENDYLELCAQKKKRMLLLALPLAILLGVLIFSLVKRIEVLTTATTIVGGVLWLFVHGLFIKPVSAYCQHVRLALHGRSHILTGAFKEMEEDVTVKDGVQYYAFLLNVGKLENEEDDRLFYYDANLPRPDWKTGEFLTITYHDKALAKWERAQDVNQ